MANILWQKKTVAFGMPPIWVPIANITGSKGVKGDTGAPGQPGNSIVGPKGTTGDTGAVGGQGATGDPGRPNIGPVGPRGNDGASWFIGTADPTGNQGQLGDYFFKTTNSPDGPILLKGDRGPPGQPGRDGLPATNGLNGITRVNISSGQSISNNTVTAIQWVNVDVDTQGAFTASSNTRLTAQTAGWYLLVGTAHWPVTNNPATTRVMDFKLNGVTTIFTTSGTPGESAVNDMRQCGSFFLHLNAADYVEMIVYQHDGGTISTTAPMYFSLIRISNG